MKLAAINGEISVTAFPAQKNTWLFWISLLRNMTAVGQYVSYSGCTVVVGQTAAGVVAARRLEAAAAVLAGRRAARVARVHLAVVARPARAAVAFVPTTTTRQQVGDNIPLGRSSLRIMLKKVSLQKG